MEKIPDENTCITLLKKVGCSPEIISHCKSVRDLAVKIAKQTDANIDLVQAGALLHDIGRSQSHGINHAVIGAKIAKQLDLCDSIIHIIERHIGAGLSPEISKKLHLPVKDYRPKTLEEKIVCHADNLIDDTLRKPIENEVEKALINGHKSYAIQLVRLHKELSEICNINLNEI